MAPWLFNVYIDEVMKKVEMGMGKYRSEISGGKGKEWRLPGLLYTDDLVL